MALPRLVPREADRFFAQPGMAAKNLTLDWWPVGTGPYMLSENDPNRRMVLSRNPNFHGQTYPCEGEAGDREAGLLADCGKALPFIDQAVFTREKESIPYWNKFLQGYFDASGISSDSFDQAVRVNVGGDVGLTDEMRDKGIRLLTSVKSSTFYMGFNMLDPVVGGLSLRSTQLRQAISIAIDQEEYISIFSNGRGIAAQGPLPPGIFGYEDGEQGIDSVVYDWVDGKPKRKPVEAAKKLMAEAGYANGRDGKTGEPLSDVDLGFFLGQKKIGVGKTMQGLFYKEVNQEDRVCCFFSLYMNFFFAFELKSKFFHNKHIVAAETLTLLVSAFFMTKNQGQRDQPDFLPILTALLFKESNTNSHKCS